MNQNKTLYQEAVEQMRAWRTLALCELAVVALFVTLLVLVTL